MNQANKLQPLEKLVIFFALLILIVSCGLAFVHKFILDDTSSTFTVNEEMYNRFSYDYAYKRNVYGEDQTPNMENSKTASDAPTPVSMWGDGFALSYTASSPSTSAYVSNYTGRIVYSVSNPNDTLTELAARQGGLPILISAVDIPAAKEGVEVILKNEYGEDIKPDFEKNAGLNPCSLNDVEGMLTERDGKYFFTRSKSGYESFVYNDVPLQTRAMALRRNDIQVFFIGNADKLYDPEKTAQTYQKMADYSKNNSFLVVGPVFGDKDKIDSINKALEKAFGDRFLNLKDTLITTDLYKSLGYNLTEKDKEAFKAGTLPDSFFMNENYFNEYINNISGYFISKRLVELGYVESELS